MSAKCKFEQASKEKIQQNQVISGVFFHTKEMKINLFHQEMIKLGTILTDAL